MPSDRPPVADGADEALGRRVGGPALRDDRDDRGVPSGLNAAAVTATTSGTVRRAAAACATAAFGSVAFGRRPRRSAGR